MNEEMIIRQIASDLHVRPGQVRTALDLFASGNTIPFIARYRKEATGTLDEQQLRQIKEQYEYEEALSNRKDTVRQSIMDQGLWSNEIRSQLEKARQLQDVEDIYLPFKPKKRTKASMARDAGLSPLADVFWNQDVHGPAPEQAAKAYISDDVPTVEEAIQGASNIIAERCSELAPYRRFLRSAFWHDGKLTCTLQEEDEKSQTYLAYKDFHEAIRRLPSHRILAINRGENQKVLKVSLEVRTDAYIKRLCQMIIKNPSPYTDILESAAADSYKRLICPQIEREIRNELTEKAEKQAIQVFAANLRSLLLQPPFTGQTILGLDPGYRTGCKAAVIDSTGAVLAYGTYHLTGSEKQRHESADALTHMIRDHEVTLISIGNGTASYETEQFVSRLIHDQHLKCRYLIANEAGASVYSASELARDELPDLDVTIRGAVSIARRIQDPLAESVKIDPQSIGVGQYQHDMNQKHLSEALGNVVEDCVNKVGVDLNTASASLLEYISGISKVIAKNIVAYREENGAFTNRRQLLKVAKLGPKAFEQCAGFMRIAGGDNPLDGTSVHPESYKAALELLKRAKIEPEEIAKGGAAGISKKITDYKKLSEELEVGEETLKDIVKELEKPARDPREEMQKPVLRTDVLDMKDLKPGMILKGTVRNVIDFGAFVDIGVHQDGLVHISQLSRKYIKHPLEAVSVGDIVEVKVLGVDMAKKRISLSMILDEE